MNIEKIEIQLEQNKNNLTIDDIEWLIAQAKKANELDEFVHKLVQYFLNRKFDEMAKLIESDYFVEFI